MSDTITPRALHHFLSRELVPLCVLGTLLITITALVTARIFPGAPHAITIAIGVIGPFLGTLVAATIGGVLLRAVRIAARD